MNNMTKIDYYGMRKVFEGRNNQTGLDTLIGIYCAKEKTEDNVKKSDRVLKGVNLSPEFIASITNPLTIIALLENSAEPSDKLKSRAHEMHDLAVDTYLCEDNEIQAEELKNSLLQHGTLDDQFFAAVSALLYLPTCEPTDIDLVSIVEFIVDEFQKKEHPEEDCDLDIIDKIDMVYERIIPKNISTILELLYYCSPNESNAVLADFIVEGIKKHNEKMNFHIANFIRVWIINSRIATVITLLEYLLRRPEFLTILKALEEVDKKNYKKCYDAFMDFCDKNEAEFMKSLTDLVTNKPTKYTGFILRNFPAVFAERINILNAWVRADRGLELDVYGPSLLQGVVPDESLDELYAIAIAKPVANKAHDFKPVDN